MRRLRARCVLVNTHAHSPMLLLRGMGGDLPLLRWLREIIWPTEAKLRSTDIGTGPGTPERVPRRKVHHRSWWERY